MWLRSCKTRQVLNFFRQVVRGFTLVALCVLLLPIVSFGAVLAALILLPLPATLPTASTSIPSQATKIYDVNGNLVRELRTFDVNIPVNKEDIPEILKQATIASEDKGFYHHKGIDPVGIGRALVRDVQNKKAVQGGSTITQQYVKLVYTNRENTLSRKIREAVLASQLDRQMPKDEILYRYLSEVYFGDGAYGVGAAAQLYFHKDVKDLDISEAATLVGVIPAPSARAPRQNLAAAEEFRKLVLTKLLEQSYITQEQFDAEVQRVLWLDAQGEPEGPATVIFGLQEQPSKYPYYTDYVEKYLKVKYGDEMVMQGGLRVQTALDPALQEAAESTVANRLNGTRPPLSMAMTSVEPQTGFVRALVGGRDFMDKKNDGQVNLALGKCPTRPADGGKKWLVTPECWEKPDVQGGGSGRQSGSSFKAVVLAAAYEKGTSPNKTYSAGSRYRIPSKYCTPSGTDTCMIGNAEGEGGGSSSIKEALVHSYNTVYVPLAIDTGLADVAKMGRKLGMADLSLQYAAPAFALGTQESSALEMASVFGVFANRGVRMEATPVVKVLDPSGKVLEDNSARAGSRVISEAVADNVTDAMRGVIERGTGNGANIGRPAAGKTGTTESFADAWFVGYTPSLSTAVWMGNIKDRQRMNYRGNTRVYGGTVPAQTWAAYMKLALKDVPSTEFSQPAPITKVNTNVIVGPEGTTVPAITPQKNATLSTTPLGDFDQTRTAGPNVDAPPSSGATAASTSGAG